MSRITPIKFSLAMALCAIGVFAHAETGITPPTQDNKAYILMDYDTGTILAQKNANEPLPPASLTKMMTSYILEQKLLSGEVKEDTPIRISENAWCRGSSSESCMYAPVGESAKAIDILRGIIIQSGNDASKATAEHLAGSESAFAVLMNDEAAKLGMTNTTFKNSTGMPESGHLTSAKDLAVLARAIIKNSAHYYGIYAEKEFTYNKITQGNRNTLLQSDPTVDGLKTGHTADAGYTLAASSNRDNLRLIAIVMGAKSMQARADQTRELLAFGYGHYKNNVIAPKDQVVATVPVRMGEQAEVQAVTASDLKVLTSKIHKGNISSITRLNDNITAPIKKGDEIGQMMAVMDGKTVATVAIVAAEDVDEAGFIGQLWQSMLEWIKSLL